MDLYFEGLSVRKVQKQIAKIFGVKISQVAIWKWIMKYPKLVKEFIDNLKVELSGNSMSMKQQQNVMGNTSGSGR